MARAKAFIASGTEDLVMSIKKDVLFLILARSGSKGVPGKNIRPLGGRPLLAYRILSAKKSKHHADIVISTDSAEYAEIAKKFGAEAPFLRPENLSHDQAKSIDAVLHAVHFLAERGTTYRYICLLEPTGPFTKTEWVDQAIDKLMTTGEQTLVACKYTSPHPVYIQDENDKLNRVGKYILESTQTNRQAHSKQITPSGNFYISTPECLEKNKSFYNENTLVQMVPEPYCLEIDTETDFLWAEFLIEKKRIADET